MEKEFEFNVLHADKPCSNQLLKIVEDALEPYDFVIKILCEGDLKTTFKVYYLDKDEDFLFELGYIIGEIKSSSIS